MKRQKQQTSITAPSLLTLTLNLSVHKYFSNFRITYIYTHIHSLTPSAYLTTVESVTHCSCLLSHLLQLLNTLHHHYLRYVTLSFSLYHTKKQLSSLLTFNAIATLAFISLCLFCLSLPTLLFTLFSITKIIHLSKVLVVFSFFIFSSFIYL